MSIVAILGIFRTFIGGFLSFWLKLPPTVRVIIMLFVGIAIGIMIGARKERIKCEAQKRESIEMAIRIDKDAMKQQLQRSQVQAEDYQKQALEAENKLLAAAAKYSTLPEGCKIDEDFLKLLNDNLSGSNDGGVPNKVPGRK